jgi:hypothetical protein
MPIDPNKVKWDQPAVTVTKIGDREIDPNKVVWDSAEGRGAVGAEPAGRTWAQVGREAISNIPESGMQMLGGLYTAVTRPRETLEQLGEVLTGAYARFIPREWMARPDKAEEFIQKANAVGGLYRDRYGSVEALKNTIATDPVGFAADVSTLTGAAAATAPGRTGQVLGTVSRVTDPTRVVTAPAAIAGRAGLNALERTAIGGKANVLLEAAEGRAPEIINALRNQPEIVPGAVPTAGEAAAPVGATRFSALQESAEKILPSEYMARRQAQDAARAASLRQVGGTEAQLTAARNARAAEARLLYGQAGAKAVVEDATLQSLQARPSVKQAFERAKTLAAEEGASFGSGGNYTAADMHYVKLALDDLIQNPATYGIGKVEASKIASTRKDFINWLEGQVPEYGTARSTFQARSKPINQMEVGQFLESKLTSALQGEQKLRPAAFAGAVEAAPQTIQRATVGAPRYEKLSDVLTPDQVKIVEDIRSDLARQAKYREQARAARPAGPSAERAGTELLVEAAGGAQLPTLLNRVTTVANAILKRLAGKIDRKLAIEIATDMLQPESAALALEAAQRRAGAVQTATGAIRAGGAAAQRAAAPAVVVTNALAGAEARRNQMAP